MRKIQRLWHWYVHGGIPESASISQLRKLQFINIVALIGFIVCLSFGSSDLPKYHLVGTIEILSGFIFLCAGLVLRFWRRPRLATNFIILATFFVGIMLAVTGGGDGAGIVWLLVFPPLLFFLEDWKASFAWVGLLLVTLASLFFTGHLYHSYDAYIYQHTSYAIVVISIVVYFYQDINRQAERINERAKHELFESNQKLHQVNTELASAKAHVEKQVVERTQSLVKEHARLDASVSSLPLGFILTDSDFFISSINSEAKRILGKGQPGTTDATDYVDALHNRLGLEAAVMRAIRQKQRVDLPEKIYAEQFLQITVAPVLVHDAPEAIGAIVLLEDITEKRIVARARDEFFLVASHELRTPLTIVEGNISLIKENFLADIQSEELHHMIDNAFDSTKRLSYIVNQLLQVSALELDEVKLKLEPVNLYELTAMALQKHQEAAQHKQIKLELDRGSDNKIMVQTDGTQLANILNGLIDNAVRNTDKGSVKLDFQQHDDIVRLELADTGRGINPENQALLFHKFHQASGDVLKHGSSQSIGLGLYLAKLIINKMSGQIYLKTSTLGKGSTFVLELPLARQNQKQPD